MNPSGCDNQRSFNLMMWPFAQRLPAFLPQLNPLGGRSRLFLLKIHLINDLFRQYGSKPMISIGIRAFQDASASKELDRYCRAIAVMSLLSVSISMSVQQKSRRGNVESHKYQISDQLCIARHLLFSLTRKAASITAQTCCQAPLAHGPTSLEGVVGG